MRRSVVPSSSLLITGLLLALLTACGQKPDGTPYGVDPAKLPAGRRAKANAGRPSPLANGMPKGAELNGVTNGASTGQTSAAGNAASPQPHPAAH
ncbi:MAG: hypothetical protein ACRYG7_06205 [Janthinobacterium lividum]